MSQKKPLLLSRWLAHGFRHSDRRRNKKVTGSKFRFSSSFFNYTHVLIKDPQWEPLQEDKHKHKGTTRVLSSFPLAPTPYCQPMTQEDHLRRIAAAPHLNCSTRTSCPSIHALCWAAWGKMGAWASPTSLGKVGPTISTNTQWQKDCIHVSFSLFSVIWPDGSLSFSK